MRESAAVKSPSPQHRSTATMPGSTPILVITFVGSGHNACHQSVSGIVVAGKKPTIMRFSHAPGIGTLSLLHDTQSIDVLARARLARTAKSSTLRSPWPTNGRFGAKPEAASFNHGLPLSAVSGPLGQRKSNQSSADVDR